MNDFLILLIPIIWKSSARPKVVKAIVRASSKQDIARIASTISNSVPVFPLAYIGLALRNVFISSIPLADKIEFKFVPLFNALYTSFQLA